MTPKTDSPIFILSCERSGSTLLRYILDTHPDIACPGELYLGRLACDLATTLARSTVLTMAPDQDEKTNDELAWKETHRILTELLTGYARARGKRIWCDKTPDNILRFDFIRQAFPDARYICLHRQSMDVLHSMLEMRENDKTTDWFEYEKKRPGQTAKLLLEDWARKTEIILDVETRFPSCRVRYEDLLADPLRTMDKVFQFLGLPWDPALLDKVFETHHDQGGGDNKIAGTKSIQKDNVGKGATIDPALLVGITPDLRARQQKLHSTLGY